MPNYKAVNAERLDAALTATADAIREKTSGTDPIPWDADTGFAEAVAGIAGGGAAVSVSMKDVSFYDYDGTRLYSYTVAEAAALTELPPLPTQPGLICQGWNWTLDAIKAMGREVDVGATYITDDGKTRIYITLTEGRTSPVLGVCPDGTVTVNWGDGSEPDTLTGTSTSTVKWTPPHHYAAPGDYVIALTVDGTMGFYGDGGGNSGILRYSSGSDARNYVYQNAVRKIECGDGVTNIGNYALQECGSLANIVIPDSVTSVGNNAFQSCYSLANIVIPDGVTRIGNNAFFYCGSLANIVIPDSVTSVGNNAFFYCSNLANIVIPDSVTSVGISAFQGCYSLVGISIPRSVTSITKNAFQECCSLTSIAISDGATSIGANVFMDCYSLASISIPDGVTSIGNNAFTGCEGMRYYDFTKHAVVPTLSGTSVFGDSIPEDCEIRVPASLVDAWKSATNWATYADYIVGV